MNKKGSARIRAKNSLYVRKLTPREAEVLELIIDGHMTESIAANLGVSQETVKRFTTRLFEKHTVSNRLELAVKVLKERHTREIEAVRREPSHFDFQSH